MDEDIFENAPRVGADIFYTDKKRCVFNKNRICVDEASGTGLMFTSGPKGKCLATDISSKFTEQS